MNKYIALAIGISVVMCRPNLTGQTLPTQTQGENVMVNDPRPLGAAVLEFEHRCGCVVTYEDVRWQPDQVVDVSGQVSRPPNAPPVLIPKGGVFAFTVRSDLRTVGQANVRRALQEVVDQFAVSGHPGRYRVMASQGMLHVLPTTGAILDTPVPLANEERTLADAVVAITGALREQTGYEIGINAPVNLFRQRKVIGIGGPPQRAGDWLARSLAAAIPEKKLSWRLLYDFAIRQYGLNVHGVE